MTFAGLIQEMIAEGYMLSALGEYERCDGNPDRWFASIFFRRDMSCASFYPGRGDTPESALLSALEHARERARAERRTPEPRKAPTPSTPRRRPAVSDLL